MMVDVSLSPINFVCHRPCCFSGALNPVRIMSVSVEVEDYFQFLNTCARYLFTRGTELNCYVHPNIKLSSLLAKNHSYSGKCIVHMFMCSLTIQCLSLRYLDSVVNRF